MKQADWKQEAPTGTEPFHTAVSHRCIGLLQYHNKKHQKELHHLTWLYQWTPGWLFSSYLQMKNRKGSNERSKYRKKAGTNEEEKMETIKERNSSKCSKWEKEAMNQR